MKKILTFLLAVIPLVTMAQTSGTCGEGLTYTYDESTHTLIIKGNGPMLDYHGRSFAPWNELFVTNIIIEEGVTSIGNYAFWGNRVTSITISNSVTSIGKGAFLSCTGLTSITLPNSVTSIGEWAFYGCI